MFWAKPRLVVPATQRHNLCPNPALTNDATGWTSNRTLTRAAVAGFDRPNAAQITGTGSGGEHFILPPPGTVAPGIPCAVSVSYRADAATSATVYILFYNAGSSIIGFVAHSGNPIPAAAGVVSRAFVVGAPPVNTAKAGIQVSLVSASTAVLQATMSLVEPVGTNRVYFDGGSTSAAWDGAAGNSTSTLSDPIPVSSVAQFGIAH